MGFTKGNNGVHGRKMQLRKDLDKEDIDAVAMGKRTEFAARVRQLVSHQADYVREMLARPEYADKYLRCIESGLSAGNPGARRTAMNHYRDIMKLAQAEIHVVHHLLSKFGLSSEEELARIVETHQQAGDEDSASTIDRLTSALEALLPMHEEYRQGVVRRLGGYLPVRTG